MKTPKYLAGYSDPVKRRKQMTDAQARYRKTIKGKKAEAEYKKIYKKTEKGKKSKQAYVQKWRERNRIKSNAHSLVTYAVLHGKLSKKPCEVCQIVDVVAHHDDYFKPLEVRWLCRTHHNQIHCFPRYKEQRGEV